MKDITYQYLYVKVSDPKDTEKLNDFVRDILGNGSSNAYAKFNPYEVNNSTDQLVTMIRQILNTVFDIIIAVTMFLCFFALTSNMTANLMEQKKEIAVMRAIGMNKCRIRLLYFYEALVMVLAACVLGVCVGLIVGYSMVL